MSRYGTFIGGGADVSRYLQKSTIYDFFVYYFGNPQMKRIKQVNGEILYGCRIPSHLLVNMKYIIATVDDASAPHGDQVTLDQIQWTSLQTRVLDEKFAVPMHKYDSMTKTDHRVSSQIKIVKKSDTIYTYDCAEFPVLVCSLLYAKTQTRVYADTGNLRVAIENFNTIFTFKGE
jgi:hypothetical protein